MPGVPLGHEQCFMTNHFFDIFQRTASVKYICAVSMSIIMKMKIGKV